MGKEEMESEWRSGQRAVQQREKDRKLLALKEQQGRGGSDERWLRLRIDDHSGCGQEELVDTISVQRLRLHSCASQFC
jgi:hypothetical protein